jgi:predicted nucleic acid-binding protein
LFDTSVLVAALVTGHPAHAQAFPWLHRAARGEIGMVVASHSLAELYAVLTSLPVRPRIGPAEARRLVRAEVESRATVVPLTSADYRTVLDRLAADDLRGGVTYDALIARVAEKAAVDRLLTLDADDFRRVWPDGADRVGPP